MSDTKRSIYEENEILINNFDYLFCKKKIEYRKLKMYLNGKEVGALHKVFKKRTSFTKFFTRGKFFIFILLNETTGLKILLPLIKRDGYEELKKVIKIQKILYKNGVSFDCEDVILEVPIKDMALNTKLVFIGYITNTDIDFKCLGQRHKYDLNDISNRAMNIFKENHIDRWNLHLELLKPKNYVLTNENKYSFIDIDPKFYFTI